MIIIIQVHLPIALMSLLLTSIVMLYDTSLLRTKVGCTDPSFSLTLYVGCFSKVTTATKINIKDTVA